MDIKKRRYFKKLTKKRLDGTRECDGKMASDDNLLALELMDVSHEYASYVRTMKMHDAVNLLLGLDLYTRDKKKTMYKEISGISSKINFSKEIGRIVTVDLFGHFGTELAYEHPAIVLGAVGSNVLIAPLSSPHFNDGKPTHVDLHRNSGVVTLNSAIHLEKIRFISKNRIIGRKERLTRDIRTRTNPNYGIEKLQEIDRKLASLLVPFEVSRFTQLTKDHQSLIQRHESLQTQLATKDNDINLLRRDLTEAQTKRESLEKALAETQETLENKDKELAEKDKEIENLKSIITNLKLHA